MLSVKNIKARMLTNQKPNFLFRHIIRDLGKCERAYWFGRTESSFLWRLRIWRANDTLRDLSNGAYSSGSPVALNQRHTEDLTDSCKMRCEEGECHCALSCFPRGLSGLPAS